MMHEDPKSIKDRVLAVISYQLGVPIDRLDERLRLQADLGADSLDATELIIELEEEFDINISDDDSENVVTVGDALNVIERLLAKPKN